MARACYVLVLLASSPENVADILDDSFDYGNASYWDHRYRKQKGTFEWYALKWDVLNATLKGHIRREHRVLHIGTGNSALPEQMYHDGFRQQVATDISSVVIEQMRERLAHLAPGLEFSVEDALRVSFPDSSFDVVIEKGTLEALSADRNCALDEPGCEMLVVEKGLVLEAFRLLRPGGSFVSVADELQPFNELWNHGLASIEHIVVKEEKDVPVPKTINLLLKKPEPVLAAKHEEV